ncbi:MAG: hypothetical protein GF393_11120 [Armatimonadia bacterium]|nr:hypothetical protein [Armatimonadia bacterium]
MSSSIRLMPLHSAFLLSMLVFCTLRFACRAVAADWQVYRSHPFVEADADSLSETLVEPATRLHLAGPQNDWLHTAIVVGVTGEDPATVTVRIDGPPHLTAHVEVRVVGFVNREAGGYALDAVLSEPAARRLADCWCRRHMRNSENIQEFPTVTATSQDPVFLWITANTRDMQPRVYRGNLIVTGEDGHRVLLPLALRVRPFALPVENPLIVQAWQWFAAAPTKADSARWMLDYGINGTYMAANIEDARAAREAGFRFFWFRFEPSWRNAPVAQADEAEVNEQIEHIQAIIDRLDLQPHEWALYTVDEPTDKTVAVQVEWAAHLRERWPEVRFCYNPAWGPGGGARNEWSSVEGTFRPLLPYANIWMPYSHFLWDDQADVIMPLMREHAEQVWFYEIVAGRQSRAPEVGRAWFRRLAWQAWDHRTQGFSWYALNAWAENPWASDMEVSGYTIMYPNNVPSRGLEAVREGIQEYKRLHELRRLGVDGETLDRFAERVLSAVSVYDIDRVQAEMDDMIERLQQ